MRLKGLRFAIVSVGVLCTVLANGCRSAPVKYTPEVLSALKTKLSGKAVVVRGYTAEPGIEQAAGPTASCREATMAFLQEKGVFGQVLAEPPGDMRNVITVDAHVTNLRIVGGAARFWGGAFAGKSEMSVRVRLTDGSTGAVILERVIDSTTNAMGAAWSGGASDRSLPYDMGGIIGELVIDTVGGPVQGS